MPARAEAVNASRMARSGRCVHPLAGGSTPTSAGMGSGCDTGVASAAVGAKVPSSYFGIPSPGSNPSFPGAVQLLASGVLDLDELTNTLPLYEGVYAPTGESVWYVSTVTDDAANAQALGLNLSSKLIFGDVGNGSRSGTLSFGGRLVFNQGAVEFTPDRILVPGAEPMPFRPAVAQPGSVGDARHSLLVKIRFRTPAGTSSTCPWSTGAPRTTCCGRTPQRYRGRQRRQPVQRRRAHLHRPQRGARL